MVTASAPGKVILFGEHAALYDKLVVATAIDRRTFVTVESADDGCVHLSSTRFGQATFHLNTLDSVVDTIDRLKEQRDFARLQSLATDPFFPLQYLVGKTVQKCIPSTGLIISIQGETYKNLGSGSAVFAALSLALRTSLGASSDLETLSAAAYIGDTLAHGIFPSGIDNRTVTYGGYVALRSGNHHSFSLQTPFHLLIIDSGTEQKTFQPVQRVRELYQCTPLRVEQVMDQLDAISHTGIIALLAGDVAGVGTAFTRFYHTLHTLDLSTPALDEIVYLGLRAGCSGVKPTGSWGGGNCIALVRDVSELSSLAEVYTKAGYTAFPVQVGCPGVRLE